MLTSTDRIVTTHVGSLVKPQPIREALAAQQAGTPYDEESFPSQLADAVTEVVSEQVGAGIDVPSDGEFSKAHWVWYVTDRLNGVEPADLGEAKMSWWMLTNDRTQFADFYAAYEPVQRYDWSGDTGAPLTRLPAPIQFAKFTGPISYKGSASVHRDIGNFKAALAAAGQWRDSCPPPRRWRWNSDRRTPPIRPTRNSSTPWPTPCTRSTRPSWTPACCCR